MSDPCNKLHLLFSDMPQMGFPFDRSAIPANGIYVLYEKGEAGHGTDRIVRIGTHTGRNQLPSRLEQHFLSENKDRSIFRKNIGRALLNKENDPFLEEWDRDLTTRAAKDLYAAKVDREKLRDTEKQVSEYIRSNFHFIVIRMDDKATRLLWESRMIGTVSLCEECQPSIKWLGLDSPKEKIRRSGLWLVNELYKEQLSVGEFDAIKTAITGIY